MDISKKFDDHVLATYKRLPLSPVRGMGARLWDESGRSYLDFCMGIAVCSLGHCHPRVTSAIRSQAETLIHCSNLYQPAIQAELAEEINLHHVGLPGKIFFSNSGAEANDGLIKSARRFGHRRPMANGSPRTEMITFQQSFHGRTLGSMAATGQQKIQEEFDPMLSGFRYLPFNDLTALETSIRPETVAIMLEPIQGEGGVNMATREFLLEIARLCQKHDLLLFFDEVQAGFGRCGHSMAWKMIAPEIEPDGISWAKGMGGGVPIGAFWLSDRLMDDRGTKLSSIMNHGSHGSTYGGNPLVCAASLAVLREIRESNLCAHALAMEARIRQTLTDWNLPAIREVRGKGLLLGIGLNEDAIPTQEGSTPAMTLVHHLMAKGLLVPAAGVATIRLLPPLNVTAEEVDEALSILRDTLTNFA